MPGRGHVSRVVQARADGAAKVNAAKAKIDEVKAQLDAKKAERLEANRYASAEEAEIIDEEEFAYIQTLKEAKGSYKASHEAMRAAAAAMEAAEREAGSLRQQLVSTFENWYAETFTDDLGATVGDAAAAAAHEAMDDDEKFEALQTENVMASNPESLAYFRANKAMMRKRGGKPLRA